MEESGGKPINSISSTKIPSFDERNKDSFSDEILKFVCNGLSSFKPRTSGGEIPLLLGSL